jgi:hypothetical protein
MPNKDINDLAEVVSMTPFAQDRSFTFQSGSQQIILKINPIAVGVTGAERRLPGADTPQKVSDFMLKKEQSLEKNVRRPGYGLGVELVFMEYEPAAGHSLDEQFKALQEYSKRINAYLKK